MDCSKLAKHLAKASAAAYKAAESIKQFGRAIGPIAKQLQRKMRPFAAAHLELEQQKRDSTEHLRLAISEQKPALWEAMRAAYFKDGASNPAARYANQILAISDAIPEQFYGAGGIKAWLLEEADRAFRVPDQIH